MYRTIYNRDDLSGNAVGQSIGLKCQQFIKDLIDEFAEYNPREIADVLASCALNEAARRFVLKRMELQEKGKV